MQITIPIGMTISGYNNTDISERIYKRVDIPIYVKGKKREDIIRVLLTEPDGSLTKYRISKRSGASISWTMDYLRHLQERSLIEGTKVTDPVGLFKEWKDISLYPKHFDFFIADPKGILKEARMDYALTTYFAENYFSKILFPSRADIYIKREEFEEWKGIIFRNKGLVGKGNLRLLVSEGGEELGNGSYLDGLKLVSKVQLMLDLIREGGVCYQAFEIMVRDHVR